MLEELRMRYTLPIFFLKYHTLQIHWWFIDNVNFNLSLTELPGVNIGILYSMWFCKLQPTVLYVLWCFHLTKCLTFRIYDFYKKYTKSHVLKFLLALWLPWRYLKTIFFLKRNTHYWISVFLGFIIINFTPGWEIF